MFNLPYIPEPIAPNSTLAKTPEIVPSKPTTRSNDETPSIVFYIEVLLHIFWFGFSLASFVVYVFQR